MKDKLKKIINHYGIFHQLKYWQSEVYELTEAIITYENTKKVLNLSKKEEKFAMYDYERHIAEEIAYVMVMLKQFQLYYEIDSREVKQIMNNKINRQSERVENEK